MLSPDAADTLALHLESLDVVRVAALRDVLVSIEDIPPAHVDIFDGLFSDAGFDARELGIISAEIIQVVPAEGGEAVPAERTEVDTMVLAAIAAAVASRLYREGTTDMSKLHDQLDALDRASKRKSFKVKVGDRDFTIAEADMPAIWAASQVAGFDREAVPVELISGETVTWDVGDFGQVARQILAQLQAKAAPAATS